MNELQKAIFLSIQIWICLLFSFLTNIFVKFLLPFYRIVYILSWLFSESLPVDLLLNQTYPNNDQQDHEPTEQPQQQQQEYDNSISQNTENKIWKYPQFPLS